jgi:hypothetical protein
VTFTDGCLSLKKQLERAAIQDQGKESMAHIPYRYVSGALMVLVLMVLLTIGCSSQRPPMVMESPVYSYIRSGESQQFQTPEPAVTMTLDPPMVSAAR